MKLKFTLLCLALMAGLQSWSQGLPFSGIINGGNGSMPVNIFYVDSIAGVSGTLVVNSGPNGGFDGLIPVTGNVMGQMMVWACISNCQGLQACDNTVWIPGTIMTFELEYCFGNPNADNDGDGWDEFSDCNDNNQWIYPGAYEECNNGIDNDCDGSIDEGCNGDSTFVDNDNDGFTSDVDCNDANAWAFPGAFEECNNGVDNDCDGLVDEDCGGTSCEANIFMVTDSMMNGATTPFVVWIVNVTDPSSNAQYVWSTGDGGTMTGAFPTWQYSETGTYELCLYMYCADGSVDTTCLSFVVEGNGSVFPGGTQQTGFTLNVVGSIPTSVNETELTTFVVSPNPVAENTTIRWNATTAGQYNIRLYNAQGQLVVMDQFNGQSGTNVWNLDANDLSSGVYQLTIQAPNGTVSSKQIVK
jgi:hypothetical protein